jgi:hypothetical protein
MCKEGGVIVITRRNLVIAVLTTFCCTAALFMILPIQSSPGNGYDPWLDINDDGTLNIIDLATIARAYGTTGEPINKTALLLELQSRVEALEERTPKFYSVIQLRNINTTSADWEDMDGVSVTISLNQTSHLLVTCTLMATTEPVERAMFLRASVGTETAIPFEYQLFCVTSPGTASTVTYYQMSVASGTHTIKMQWRINPVIPSTAWAVRIALTVIALPA